MLPDPEPVPNRQIDAVYQQRSEEEYLEEKAQEEPEDREIRKYEAQLLAEEDPGMRARIGDQIRKLRQEKALRAWREG